jgi:hypothetical protein
MIIFMKFILLLHLCPEMPGTVLVVMLVLVVVLVAVKSIDLN